jgi:hypothetical protein
MTGSYPEMRLALVLMVMNDRDDTEQKLTADSASGRELPQVCQGA